MSLAINTCVSTAPVSDFLGESGTSLLRTEHSSGEDDVSPKRFVRNGRPSTCIGSPRSVVIGDEQPQNGVGSMRKTARVIPAMISKGEKPRKSTNKAPTDENSNFGDDYSTDGESTVLVIQQSRACRDHRDETTWCNYETDCFDSSDCVSFFDENDLNSWDNDDSSDQEDDSSLHTIDLKASDCVLDPLLHRMQPRRRRQVSFGSVFIREYSLTVGDHPYTRDSCPLTLAWQHTVTVEKELLHYEHSRYFLRSSTPPRRLGLHERRERICEVNENLVDHADVKQLEVVMTLSRLESMQTRLQGFHQDGNHHQDGSGTSSSDNMHPHLMCLDSVLDQDEHPPHTPCCPVIEEASTATPLYSSESEQTDVCEQQSLQPISIRELC